MVVTAGEILNDVINDYTDLDNKMARLTAMEHDGDKINRALVRKLNTSFILPFDREDALLLVQTLSTTLDFITGIIDRMILYKAGEPNTIVKEMVAEYGGKDMFLMSAISGMEYMKQAELAALTPRRSARKCRCR
jgi:uncharacterized protein Yka (UPF0111/DUF47 family)